MRKGEYVIIRHEYWLEPGKLLKKEKEYLNNGGKRGKYFRTKWLCQHPDGERTWEYETSFETVENIKKVSHFQYNSAEEYYNA